MDTGKSALGLDGNVAAALGYPIGIIAIICLVMEKENRFVKFHALQSILLHVGFIVVAIAVWIIGFVLLIAGMAASTENAAIQSTGTARAAASGTVHLRSVRAPQITMTAATGRPWRVDVSSSIAVNPNEPSPHSATTGRSGRAAFIPIAHGRPMPRAPIADADDV